MIKVLRKNFDTPQVLSLSELEELMEFTWRPHLAFSTPEIALKVKKRTGKALRKKEITAREKYLGVNFHREITKGSLPSTSIRFIDDVVGYGVFAERAIPKGVFIGEYTGVVRKRLGRVGRFNDYTFEYAIGDWERNPFIIDAKQEGNLTRFINHSARPNLGSVSVYANEVMHIILVALKPIPKGAQLCYDYGDIYWKKRQKALVDL